MTGKLMMAIAVALAIPDSVAAQRQPIPAANGRVEALKPGEYLWAPGIAPEGPVTIIVSLKTQKAYAYRNGVAIGVSTVSTGTKGFATPTEVFTVLQKDADHVSNLYKDAAMPFMQRLTWGGIVMHAGNLPGYLASHGCIRMPLAFAELLFGITRMGITVVITRNALVPVVVTTPGVLKRDERATGGDRSFAWNPARAPTGPVSIVISGRDRRVVVLRNGVEIGSSTINLDAPVEETAAFTLQAIDHGGEHWLRLPLPGQTGTGELSDADRAKGRFPNGFRAALPTVLTPGATLLVTRETLASASTGKAVTVIEADLP
ncbi:L,D-transpeptidase family protein [Sphingomonas sp. LR60]|uniref:L,D-transpeptidase family protein n=1 Tax=Sphingomonas sp. LR60 TaxID=3050233 RepID=UPI002FE411A7